MSSNAQPTGPNATEEHKLDPLKEEGQKDEQAEDQEADANIEKEEDENEEEDDEKYAEKPLKPQLYVSEYQDETIKEIQMFYPSSRPLLKQQFIKKRREFYQMHKFQDANADKAMEFKSQATDPFHPIEKKILDMGLQASNQVEVTQTQTTWFRKANKTIQVTPIADQTITEDPNELMNFLNSAYPLMEEALQANETIDVFQDDFNVLGEEDLDAADRSMSNDIKEIKSLNWGSKGKKVSCVQFQPHNPQINRKIVANSFVENLTFDERAQLAIKSYKSSIIFWDFEDVHSIEPLFILISPLEIVCFEFNPKDPNLVVAGTVNGQVVMWDLKSVQGFAYQSSKKQQKSKSEKNQMQEVPHLLLSALQDPGSISAGGSDLLKKNINSHKNAILCLRWLPNSIEIDRKNFYNLITNTSGANNQFATISEDGQVLIWDIRFGEKDPRKNPDVQITWRAIYGMQLYRPEGGGIMGGNMISFFKNQKTPTFVGTSDEGELFILDWCMRPSEDMTKSDMVTHIWQQERNFRPAILSRSPFFEDVFLTAHDYYFCIWKTDIENPIFQSMTLSQERMITCGSFSPFRPGVVIIGCSDGQLDIWDFLDISHKPTLVHRVVSEAITVLTFHETIPHYLAIGDANGNLHMVELPYTLCKKQGDEEKFMEMFWEREVKRVEYYQMRFEARKTDEIKQDEQDKLIDGQQQAQQQQRHMHEDKNANLTEDEIFENEYQQFVKLYMENDGKIPVKEEKEKK